MKSTIQTCKPIPSVSKYPQLFRGKLSGNIYLYSTPSKSTTVHIGVCNGKDEACYRTLGEIRLYNKDPYKNYKLEIFEGTIELTNP